jgi:pseudaminic acid cytidylyltransferase
MAGLPVLGRVILTAKVADVFDEIVVSSDSQETLALAETFGASTMLSRPADLSDDYARTDEVVAHGLREMGLAKAGAAVVCCLYPTAVLVKPTDLSSAQTLLPADPLIPDVVAAVVSYRHPIQRAMMRISSGHLVPRYPEGAAARTQDLEPSWHDAGQFYWAHSWRWLQETPILNRVIPYELPVWRGIDIDTEDDWLLVEGLLSQNGAEGEVLGPRWNSDPAPE